MIDKALLSILACPQTKKDLELVDEATLERVNQLIEQGKLRNYAQEVVKDKIDGGLFRVGDRKSLYPIRDNIPVLLVDELILLD